MAGATRAVFLSYRREETRHIAGRLADRLTDRLGPGQVFMDVETIEPGADFAAVIAREVGSCRTLIALIGPTWATTTNQQRRRRLDDPNDFVVLEIRAALERGTPVIPVLVDGARMPDEGDLPGTLQGLRQRQAARLDHETFPSDVTVLLNAVDRILSSLVPSDPPNPRNKTPDQRAHSARFQSADNRDGVEIGFSMLSVASEAMIALFFIAFGIIGTIAGLKERSGYGGLEERSGYGGFPWFVVVFIVSFFVGLICVLHVLYVSRMRLVVDRNGIWQRCGNQESWHLPWAELSAVEFRYVPKGQSLILVATPVLGSSLPVDKKAKRLWSERDCGFVIGISEHGLDRHKVSAALVRYSGGRYRAETSRM